MLPASGLTTSGAHGPHFGQGIFLGLVTRCPNQFFDALAAPLLTLRKALLVVILDGFVWQHDGHLQHGLSGETICAPPQDKWEYKGLCQVPTQLKRIKSGLILHIEDRSSVDSSGVQNV